MEDLAEFIQNTDSAVNISKNLLTAKTEREFELWFDKIWKLNPKICVRFLRDNAKDIKIEYVEKAKIILENYGVKVRIVNG